MSNRVLNVILAQAGIQLYPNRNLSDNNKIPPHLHILDSRLRGNDGMGLLFEFISCAALLPPLPHRGVAACFGFASAGRRSVGKRGFSGTNPIL